MLVLLIIASSLACVTGYAAIAGFTRPFMLNQMMDGCEYDRSDRQPCGVCIGFSMAAAVLWPAAWSLSIPIRLAAWAARATNKRTKRALKARAERKALPAARVVRK